MNTIADIAARNPIDGYKLRILQLLS